MKSLYPEETPIYRIYNLYDLITTLEKKKLRLASASLMEDKNELVGDYLLSINSSYGPESAYAHQKMVAEYEGARCSRYMICWSRSSDSIALWSLYSPTQEGVMAKSTMGKLKRCVDALFYQQPYDLAYSLPPNDPKDLYYPPKIDSVRYIDLSTTFQALTEIRANYKITVEAMRNTSRRTVERLRSAMDNRADESQKLFDSLGCEGLPFGLLKDKRYAHEEEIRAIIQLVRRDHRTKEEYESHRLAGLDDPVRPPASGDCPMNIFAPIEDDFIEELQIDGRLPLWKQDAISIILEKFGLPFTVNKAFVGTREREEWVSRLEDHFL